MLESKMGQNARKQDQLSLELNSKQRLSSIRVRGKRPEVLDYELKQTLGLGGFGTVRKAVHRLTGETVAVKICLVGENRVAAESIAFEIEHQRALIHENIAQIYEVVQHEGKVYIFMEYCSNGELFERINRTGPIAERESARISHQILSALIYLKANRLSHRDIKPENVLFDAEWNVKLIDFGFCCRNMQEKTMRDTVCGTPSYTPPQIIRRAAYDPQLVDVWSFGVTLYAMVAAQLPFQGLDSEQRRKNILNFRFNQLPVFSAKLQRLFSSIFVDAKYRPRLQDLLNSEFFLSYDFATAQCINMKHQNPEVQQKVVNMIEKAHQVAGARVAESVKGRQFDRFNALYYLTLKSVQHSNREVSLFKKRKRSSLIKLEPISHTPTIKGKAHNEQLLMLKTGGMKPKESRPKPRLVIDTRYRNRDQPDSPRRLIDCLAAYKQF